jgi:hypothetical protein
VYLFVEARLSWCDKLASVPIVGATLDWHFATGDMLLEAISPVLRKFVESDKQTFKVERSDASSMTVATNAGFQFAANATSVSVGFQHMLRPRPVSGGLPVMEMLSTPRPYTELLSNVIDYLIETTVLMPNIRARQLSRIGIVSTTVVSDDQTPPGVSRFTKYVGRPWKGAVDYYSFQIVAEIHNAANWSDRCVHSLVKSESDPDGLLQITLDWQRRFRPGRAVTVETLSDIFRSAETAALGYFEDVAEGGRFDEDIIRTTA